MWRRAAVRVVAVVIIAACSTSNRLQVIEPEIVILPLDIPAGRPVSLNVFSHKVLLNVLNRSSEPLVLERLVLSTVGEGPYTIQPGTHTYNFSIPSGGIARVEAWVQMIAENRPGGVEGDIMVRGVAFFRTPENEFRRMFMQKMQVGRSRGTGF